MEFLKFKVHRGDFSGEKQGVVLEKIKKGAKEKYNFQKVEAPDDKWRNALQRMRNMHQSFWLLLESLIATEDEKSKQLSSPHSASSTATNSPPHSQTFSTHTQVRPQTINSSMYELQVDMKTPFAYSSSSWSSLHHCNKDTSLLRPSTHTFTSFRETRESASNASVEKIPSFQTNFTTSRVFKKTKTKENERRQESHQKHFAATTTGAFTMQNSKNHFGSRPQLPRHSDFSSSFFQNHSISSRSITEEQAADRLQAWDFKVSVKKNSGSFKYFLTSPHFPSFIKLFVPGWWLWWLKINEGAMKLAEVILIVMTKIHHLTFA